MLVVYLVVVVMIIIIIIIINYIHWKVYKYYGILDCEK